MIVLGSVQDKERAFSKVSRNYLCTLVKTEMLTLVDL